LTMDANNAPRRFELVQNIAGDSRWTRALVPVAILGATFLVYTATLALGFVSDDQTLIMTNGSIRSWSYFPSYFTSHIWSFRYPHQLWNAYRPTLLIWLRLNDVLFGPHVWGWHLSLVAAHVAVTYLVYRLIVRLTRDPWIAAAGALIFGLHPVHTETTAVASWADQPLSTFFVLATVLTWWRSREAGRKGAWLAASMALCAAALLSKESSLMLPVLIGGCAWIYGGAYSREVAPVEFRFFPRLRSALGASIPYWVVIFLYMPLRIWALKGFAYVITPLSLSTEIYTIPSVLLFYLRLLIWPSGLSCYYDTPYVSTPGWHDFVLPVALLAAAAGALFFWYGRTRQSEPESAKVMAFACLWMVLTVLPVLNFRFLPEGEIAHDRYLYLPSVGFALLVAIALRQAVGAAKKFCKPAWALGGALVLSGVMGVATARQCLFWSDDLTLSVRAHEIAPHNATATTSLAAAVAARGMDGKAMALYQQALALRPDFWVANRNLAYLYFNHGDYPQAVHLLARSLASGPEEGDQFLILGLSLLRTGRFIEAEKAVRAALLLRPQGKRYHLGLGMVLRGEGKLPEASQEFAAELAADEQNAQARTLLGEVTQQMQEQAATPAAAKPPKGEAPNSK
jgi:tetratricopeptide (TPR) repeat protein